MIGIIDRPRPRTARNGLGIAALGAFLGLALGLTLGAPGELISIVLLGIVGALAVGLVVSHPERIVGVLLAHTIIFPVLPISAVRGINLVDALLGPALLGAWLWSRTAIVLEQEPPPQRSARHALARWTFAFYGFALLSIAVMVGRLGGAHALDSLLVLSRSMQGALYFYLVVRLVRTPDDLRRARNALFVGLAVAVLANLFALILFHVPRAGGVWVWGTPSERSKAFWSVGEYGWYVTNPNELAAGCLLIWALVLAFPLRRSVAFLFLVASLWLILATLSRSGILGWFVFVLVYGLTREGRQRPWIWLFPLAFLLVIPILPPEFRLRMMRTLLQERGSFEVYTSIVRFFSWHAALSTFLANPVLGVGYLGFRFVSQNYNALGLALAQAENYYLEMAAGMGIPGVIVLAGWGGAYLRLARTIRRVSAPASLGCELAATAPAYLAGIAVGNLTADNLVGLMGVSQIAVFVGLMVAAARSASGAPRRRAAES